MAESTDIAATDQAAGQGLSRAEIDRLREIHGPNEVPAPRPPRLYQRLGAQLRDPLVLLLLAAAVVTIALRDLTDTLVIVLVIVLNTTVGIVQEFRADRAVAALRQLSAPTAQAVRDGSQTTLPAVDLVPGDLVRVSAGDIVPADLTITRTTRLRVDEAALSGESMSVSKKARDPALAGTVVVDGAAWAVVERTGASSALGHITALVAAQPRRRTPLQRRLAGLGRTLGAAAVVLSGVVMLAGLLRGLPVAEMVLTGVSLTVAAVPESLPAVVTVALALGAYRMARRRAIVRQLPAVETLGSVTLVASDKTGTLTEGRMSCERAVLPHGSLYLSGEGYRPSGSARSVGRPDGDAVLRLARDLVLCNDADLVPPRADNRDWAPVGDPMEAALIAAAGRLGAPETDRTRHLRLDEISFETARRRMTTLHECPGGGYLVVGKGAPETILVGDDADTGMLRAAADRLTHDGYRVLAVADSWHESRPDRTRWEATLRPVGLVALTDPVRDGTAQLVAGFRRAGVHLAMITGDHPATAQAVARAIGLPAEPLTTGDQLASQTPDAESASVFARTRPEQKMDLVRAWQRDGQVVAMTGDGVNDAPALRQADIGVAMGRSGTEAARQAADLVLADDNLATLAAAVSEGRRIYANIRRFLRYALSGGLAEVLVMILGPFMGLAVPLLPAQILWINMLTHGLPGVALGAEPADRGVGDQPPRRPGEAILGVGLAARVAVTGALITAVSLGTAGWAAATGRPWQSLLFLVLGFAQLGVALAVRAHPPRGTRSNRALFVAVASSAVLQAAAVLAPPLRELLGTQPVELIDGAICLGVAAVPGLLLLCGRLAGPRGPDRRRVHDAGIFTGSDPRGSRRFGVLR
ncbi:MAG: cation-transporting P-type ATPase [Actinocatenispora sp.]